MGLLNIIRRMALQEKLPIRSVLARLPRLCANALTCAGGTWWAARPLPNKDEQPIYLYFQYLLHQF